MAALLAQLLQAAVAVRDYHRQTANEREAAAVTHELHRLTTLQSPRLSPEPGAIGRDGRKVPAYGGRQRRQPNQGPGLQVPAALQPRQSQPGLAVTHQTGRGRDDDGGR